MSLRAIVNMQDVLAPQLSDEEWSELQALSKAKNCIINLPCCQGSGYPRVSKLGTRHFVHKKQPENCDWERETADHLSMKSQIVQSCFESGWNACTEVTGPDWRADVLATKGKHKIAFEIQLSPQSMEETQFRQERYRQSGIKGYWIFRKLPSNALQDPSVELPMFEVCRNEDSHYYNITIGHGSIPFDAFINNLLAHRIRFKQRATTATKQKIRIVFWEILCWKCEQPYHIYYTFEPWKSVCGIDIHDDNYEEDISIAFQPETISSVMRYLRSSNAPSLKLGTIGKRWSSTVEDRYVCFSCPSCKAMYGDFFYRNESLNSLDDLEHAVGIFCIEITFNPKYSVEMPHWCITDDEGMMCQSDDHTTNLITINRPV